MFSACYAFDCSTVNHSLFLNPSASVGVVNDIDWWICFITLIVSILQYAQRMKLAFRGCNTWLVLVVLLMLKPSMALPDVDSFIVPPSILLDPQTPFHLSHRSGNSSLRRVLNSFVHQSRSSPIKKIGTHQNLLGLLNFPISHEISRILSDAEMKIRLCTCIFPFASGNALLTVQFLLTCQ